jgi:hypothetical protein
MMCEYIRDESRKIVGACPDLEQLLPLPKPPLSLIDVPATYQYLRSSNVPDDCIAICPKAQHGKALFLPSDGMALVCKDLGIAAPT